MGNCNYHRNNDGVVSRSGLLIKCGTTLYGERMGPPVTIFDRYRQTDRLGDENAVGL